LAADTRSEMGKEGLIYALGANYFSCYRHMGDALPQSIFRAGQGRRPLGFYYYSDIGGYFLLRFLSKEKAVTANETYISSFPPYFSRRFAGAVHFRRDGADIYSLPSVW